MEIRTCEEYVLEELRAAKQNVERLESALENTTNQLNSIASKSVELYSQTREAAKLLNIKLKYDYHYEYKYIEVDGIFVFSEKHNPEGYSLIKNLFKLSEPENDRTDRTEESD